ncbi:MAG: DUF2283 domain-containing protein [Nocardioides sp.]|nr:DUF2283 domain-containing protein [Nocardioides sp.]
MYVSYDPAARATYVRLTDAKVVSTKDVTDLVMVDLDEHQEPVGVEFLTLPNRISADTLHQLADAYPSLKALVDTDRWLLPALQMV